MTTQSNFPTISDNLNYHSANIQAGGQKASVGSWVAATYVDIEVPLTGKWYWEYITDNYVYAFMGIGRLQYGSPHHHNTDFAFVQAGEYRYNGVNQANTASIGTGDIVGVYVNDGITKVYVNNSLDHTYSQNLSLVGQQVFPVVFGTSNTTINFGQDSSFLGVKTAQGNTDANGVGDFYYTPPDNALALCSANAPTSSDIDPGQTDDDHPQKQMNVLTYTGNGSTRSITGLGFKPDLIFLKARNYASVQQVYDSSRGGTKQLYPSQTGPEATYSYLITSFDNDGWSMGNGDTDINYSSRTFVTWCFRANGGVTTSDSSGDITVTRQTNDAAKFSILTYTGNGSSGSTIAHGLGVKPAMTIIKQRNSSNGWNVWHQGNNNGDYDSFGELNSNSSWYQNQGSNGPFTAAPGTDYLTLTAYGQVNGTNNTYVAYVWADVDGYSKFSFYEGNGNANGPFIYTGFRPRFLFIKGVDNASNWELRDTERDTFNPLDTTLLWDSTSAEVSSSASNAYPIDILSNGFKIRTTSGNYNTSGNTYVYGAWGDVPFKYNNTF